MKKIAWHIALNSEVQEGIICFPDDTTDEEIEEQTKEIIFNDLDYGWTDNPEVVTELENSGRYLDNYDFTEESNNDE